MRARLLLQRQKTPRQVPNENRCCVQVSFFSSCDGYIDRGPAYEVRKITLARDRLLDATGNELAQFALNSWITRENEVYESATITSGTEQHHESVTTPSASLQAAIAYLEMGWSPLALCPRDHFGIGPEHRRICTKPGKVPIGDGRWKQWQARRATKDELLEQWRRQPNANVGVIMGEVSRLVGLDVDLEDAGTTFFFDKAINLFANTEWQHLTRDTLWFTTGKGARFLYLLPKNTPPPPSRRTPLLKNNKKIGMIELLSEGTISVMPPSLHKNGRTYTWGVRQGVIAEYRSVVCNQKPQPERLLTASELLNSNTEAGSPISEGMRNTIMFKAGCALRRFGAAEPEIVQALQNMNARCSPPLAAEELFTIAKQAARYKPSF